MIALRCKIYHDYNNVSTSEQLPADLDQSCLYCGKSFFNIVEAASNTSFFPNRVDIVVDYDATANWDIMAAQINYTLLTLYTNYRNPFSEIVEIAFPLFQTLPPETTTSGRPIILEFANGYIRYDSAMGSNPRCYFFNSNKTKVGECVNFMGGWAAPYAYYVDGALSSLYSIAFEGNGVSGLRARTFGASNFYPNSTTVLNFLSGLEGVEPDPPADTDPYSQGGNSGSGGGGGSFDLSSDAVDFPSLPTLTAVSTGLVSVYTPNLTQLNSLANFLWNANPTDVDFWKKLVANPLDLILGLSIVPVAVPAGASQNIKVGLVDTGVAMTKAASQFVEVLCGTIEVPEYWGSALDYSPFRRFSIYLPFIGTRTISTDDIMGKTVEVRYHVDLLSGACVAMVKCGDAVLYQYSGACAVSLPLSGETFTNVITSTIQLAASIGATVATGGAAAGVTAASAANSLMSMKPIVERAGGVSGAAGQLGVMTPYLIGEIPRQSVPAHANTFMGYPSNITAVIGDLTGYTEVDLIHISGIEATQAELDELEEILKGGFII